MKIKLSQLRRIIKEEVKRMHEMHPSMHSTAYFESDPSYLAAQEKKENPLLRAKAEPRFLPTIEALNDSFEKGDITQEERDSLVDMIATFANK